MTISSCSSRVLSPAFLFPLQHLFRLSAAVLSVVATCAAQPVAPNLLPDAPSAARTFLLAAAQAQAAPDQAPITIPAGTRLSLVLANTVDSRNTKTGDQVSAQVTTPVVADNKVVIPAGTFVQGRAQKLTRRGTQAEMLLQPGSLVFPDGYVATLSGPVNMESDEWTALNNPSPGSKAAIILVPLISLPVGALIGKAADTKHTTNFAGTTFTTESHTGLIVGTTLGFAGGLGTSLALMAHSHGFYIEQGAPMSMTLPQPVTLTQSQVDSARSAPPPPQVPVVQKHPNPGISSGGNGPVFAGPASCTAGQEWCEGQCKDSIDFISDSSNCGRCGNQCSFSETCTGGSCVCAPGYTSCMGQCMNDASFISDNNNCGSCGRSCSIGETCMGGSCMKVGP
jgi:hypothetical protein